MLNNLFINPDGSNKTEVKETLANATTMLVDFLSSADQKPLLPTESDLQNIQIEIPDLPLNESNLQSELEKVIRLSMNPANPTYIGHMDSLPSVYSIIGSLFSSALNNNMFSPEMSPYFTRLEYALTTQFASIFGLPATASGVIVSGGTLSNIQAIITARNFFLGNNEGDISKANGKLVLFASEHAHVSIKKAAMIGGLGIDSLINVSADANGKMNVQDLQKKIKLSVKQGHKPFAAIATIGTTVTGNIDPIEEIADICKQNKLWFHADAIYGGALILSKKEKHRLKGIERADSISFNPQKWMHVAKTCSLLMFRDEEILKKYFSMKAFYTKDQGEFVNLSELNIQGTKHAEVLKLWLSILSIGLSGYEKMINDAMTITNRFIQNLNQIPGIEFASVTEMNIPTFRLKGQTEEVSNNLNRAFNEYVIREHNIFFSLPTYNGKLWQRTILLNPFIDDSTINKVVSAITQFFQLDHKIEKAKLMSSLSIREMEEEDIDNIIHYFLEADHDFLVGMGVETSKLPNKNEWRNILLDQLKLPLHEKQFYYTIWLVNGEPIGHCNINKINSDQDAYMHLHMWTPDTRKKGMGTTLVKMSISHFFDRFNLKKLYCEPYTLNPAPNAVLKKVGFNFVKTHVTTPGWINFEQPVNLWELSKIVWEN